MKYTQKFFLLLFGIFFFSCSNIEDKLFTDNPENHNVVNLDKERGGRVKYQLPSLPTELYFA